MSQVTWRTSDELLDRVRRAARGHGWSVNRFITSTLDVATDPGHATSATERIAERLAAAGLLAQEDEPMRNRPPEDEVATASRNAGRGTSLSDLVVRDR